MDFEKGPLVEIMKGFVVRVSLVDDGAYPQSSVNVRMEQPTHRTELRLTLSEAEQPKRYHKSLMVV